MLITGGADASIQVWPDALSMKREHNTSRSEIAPSEMERMLVSTALSESRQQLTQLTVPNDFVRCLHISACRPNSLYLFTDRGRVLLCDLDVIDTSSQYASAEARQNNETLVEIYACPNSLGACLSCDVMRLDIPHHESADLLAIAHSRGFVTLLTIEEGKRFWRFINTH